MNIKTKILFLTILLTSLCGWAENTSAERFFQKPNTWYEKIPANPAVHPDSSNIVADVVANSRYLMPNYRDWSVGIWYADVNTPMVTVDVWASAATKDIITSRGWHQVPIPTQARAPGNDLYCDFWNGLNTTGKRDAHMVVVSADRRFAWDFYHALWCNNQWHTQTVRKWDLTGDGINYPYDNLTAQRLASVPLTHGVITYKEVVNEGRIDHAMAVAGWASRKLPAPAYGRYGVYPSGKYNAGLRETPYAPIEGMRFQLNPSYNCSVLTDRLEKMVCVAMQEYGFIYVDDTSPGDESLYFEDRTYQPTNWSGIINTLSHIPLNQFRVVNPIYPSIDTTPPANPTGLRVQ